MAIIHLGPGDNIHFVAADGETVFGEGGDDSIEGFGSDLTLLGGCGDDTVGWVFGDRIFAAGGVGGDEILLNGRNNTLVGGRGADHLRAEGQTASLFGGAGDDSLGAGYGSDFLARGGVGADSITGASSNSSLYGDAGDDQLRLAEGSSNALFGGAGDDTLSGSSLDSHDNTLVGGIGHDELTARDTGNILYGGADADMLASVVYALHETGDGTLLTGGSGEDRFYFENPTHLTVMGDTNQQLSAGDVVAGGLDTVLDYHAGETIDLFGEGYRRVSSAVVDVSGGDFENPAPHQHVAIRQQTYAIFHGELTAPGVFRIAAGGGDTLVIYVADYGQGSVPTGAVVLSNYADDVLIV